MKKRLALTTQFLSDQNSRDDSKSSLTENMTEDERNVPMYFER